MTRIILRLDVRSADKYMKYSAFGRANTFDEGIPGIKSHVL